MITYRVEGRTRQPSGWTTNRDDVVECADLAVAEQNARVMSSTCDQVMFLHYKRVKQLQPPKPSLFRRTMNLWNEIIKNKRRAENEAWDARREIMFRMPKD